MARRFQHSAKLVFATALLLSGIQAYGAEGVCSTASIINPNTIDGGMGGTGAPAKGGTGGTGIIANRGAGGTGISGGTGGTGVIANGGAGGTGIEAEHGGIGGTGISGGTGGTGITADGGLGGTGIIADKGLLPDDSTGGISIVGVVTGFASICVNNEEVFYDAKTPVFDNGKVAQLGHLAAGKMVMLKADRVAGRLQARAIGMFDAVAGPMGKVDMARQQVQVLGQNVRVDNATMQQMASIATGTDVRVSGHRLNNGDIVATRVEIAKNNAGANTLGLVTSLARDGFMVNGTRVNIGSTKMLEKIVVGSEVRVAGRWDGRAITAERVETQPIINMINRADSAIIEGYARATKANSIRLEGTAIEISLGKISAESMAGSNGKVVKIEMRRDSKGGWVCDKLEQRKGRLFNSKNSNQNGSNSGSGGDDDSSGSGSGSNSGSASGDSGSSGTSGSSSSGSGRDDRSGAGSSGSSGSGRDDRSGSGASGLDRGDRSGASGSDRGDRSGSRSGGGGRN